MISLPIDEYVEERNGGYYVAGTRVSLESVAYAIQRGQTIEEILADFPALKSRRNLEGAIALIASCPDAINAYLAQGERDWEEARKLNPPELIEKMRAYRAKQHPKSA